MTELQKWQEYEKRKRQIHQREDQGERLDYVAELEKIARALGL
jgi:hypothetical protein